MSTDATPRSPLATLYAGFAAALLVVGGGGLVTYRSLVLSLESGEARVHTLDVLKRLTDVELAHARATARLSQHILTGRESDLDSHRTAVGELTAGLADVRTLTRDNPVQQRTLSELDSELERRLFVMRRGLELFQQGGTAEVQRFAGEPGIRDPERRVGELIDALRLEEERLLSDRERRESGRIDALRRNLVAWLVVTAIVLALLSWRARRDELRRRAAELEADAQRTFLDRVIESVPMPIYVKDAATLRLVRVNRAVEALTGLSRDTMIGADDRLFFEPAFAERYIASERALVASGVPSVFERVELDTPEGRRHLEIRKVLIPDERGRPRFLLGITDDATERLEAQRQRDAAANEIARRGAALESANQELESFSYSVSHDLQAPLRAIDGYAAMLEEDYGGRLDAEGHRFLRAIRDGATRMGQLIQDLLAFSRVGRQPLVREHVPMREIVADAWQAVSATTPRPGVELDVGELPDARGDPRLLRQVWTNLLDNAAKYSARATQPRVVVRGERRDGGLHYSVRDNGIGFDMRHREKLFEVFQRLHADAGFTGTGVGLAIVARIVARHGGSVDADGAPGLGATFSFSLPDGPATGGP